MKFLSILKIRMNKNINLYYVNLLALFVITAIVLLCSDNAITTNIISTIECTTCHNSLNEIEGSNSQDLRTEFVSISNPLDKYIPSECRALKVALKDMAKLGDKKAVKFESSRKISNGDPQCDEFNITLSRNNTFLPRALISYPGSGNTWLRHLIESSTGHFTGSVYEEKVLHDSGFLGELRVPSDGSTIVQKTHDFSIFSDECTRGYMKISKYIFEYRGILLIRNPYKALPAFWNLLKSQSHTEIADKSTYSTAGWKEFVEKGARNWADLVKTWITNSKDLHVVLYEDLKRNLEQEMIEILDYLKVPVDYTRLKCAMKYTEGLFHRKSKNKSRQIQVESESKIRFCPFKDNTDLSGNISLELIVQNNIDNLNSFLMKVGFPLFLNYTTSTER